ncbi:fumonisin B1 esterase [Trichonephila clavata]|uniref:Fumonisin B1 esterase n=1 Tax=Trichonephila clavata TaxID=2740835 RepID=A0A8X6IR31_TRICU|nr:fumonisin B1 esterase [Trichonephila clavata]
MPLFSSMIFEDSCMIGWIVYQCELLHKDNIRTVYLQAGLEVLVWIHGGFLQWGSGHEPGICPSGRVAKRLNAVFVSFNYRLGALGFMALDVLSQMPQDAKGNYGLWDQIVALQWVQHNIRAFGGDPDKVTVFGADSGGASIMALRASEAARGLFRTAWLLGPAITFNRTFDDLSQHNRAFFLARSGCKNDTCLRHMSAKAVVETYLWKDEPSFRIRDQNDLPIQGIYSEQLIVLDDKRKLASISYLNVCPLF